MALALNSVRGPFEFFQLPFEIRQKIFRLLLAPFFCYDSEAENYFFDIVISQYDKFGIRENSVFSHDYYEYLKMRRPQEVPISEEDASEEYKEASMNMKGHEPCSDKMKWHIQAEAVITTWMHFLAKQWIFGSNMTETTSLLSGFGKPLM
ncbi:hypothetical protein G7Y89_g9026 [Cudoniella acicularis]|uniref:Uncharacterized protein n=1 Tax=Cudoniella acicularis TaxID=354080 RepID=A0A8H4RGE2_9HELO|nr:hypothetical protein G7Y89_g9026 [Cudoniella acicularis]